MLKNLLGDPNARKLKIPALCYRHQPPRVQALSDEQLTGKTAEFKQRLEKAKPWTTLPEAFAVVREAGRRVLGLHFDVQLLGGIILHKGRSPK